MTPTEFKKGTVIHSKGEPMRFLSLIASGEAEASFCEYKLVLEKTDVIGLCDLDADGYYYTYTAKTDVTVYQYPYEGPGSLDALLGGNADIAYLTVKSMCRQISEIMQYWSRHKRDALRSYELAVKLYPEYGRLSKLYAFTPKKLPGLSEVVPLSETSPVEAWLHDYYKGIKDLKPVIHKQFFYGNTGISAGFLRKCTEDIEAASRACGSYLEYTSSIAALFLDKSGLDLFSLISELHISAVNIKGADEAVTALITPLTELLPGLPGIDPAYFQSRLNAYKDDLAAKKASEDVTDAPVSEGINQSLLDSTETILGYSGCLPETREEFARCIREFTELSAGDRTDDAGSGLRRALTSHFYDIYKQVLIKSIDDPSPPTVIKMFLNFGYVDATLAGYENADYMYSVADSLKGDPENNIYTISEWLIAIYKGYVEPSLSEFDMDYAAYVREMKVSKQIDAKEEARLLTDQEGKLRYELESAFPVLNRVTFGRPSRFCPVFADHNIQRRLESLMVTPAKIKDILDEIRGVDFSAYYRPTAYTDPKYGIKDETINVEVLPNIVLMPTMGIRGSMWQDIEGRKRTTAARMFLPVFLDNELKALLIRLTGEFRWEICRRVQGARWNDVTDPSLTSLYCDYLQFYMNNRSLSMETMMEIRNELSSARNNFKTVFVSNYAVWLLNESKGSSRLNKTAQTIMSTFCPFTAGIRESLMNNPRYADVLAKYNNKQAQRAKRLTNLVQQVSQRGKGVPQELYDEIEFSKR